MHIPTIYSITTGGRIQCAFFAVLLGGLGLFPLTSFFAEGTKAYDQGLLPYFLGGLVLFLWFGYASYCGLRAIKSAPSFIVDESGFMYEGVFKTLRFEWKDITALQKIEHPRYGDKWLKVKSRKYNKVYSVKLDFSGISPDMNDFINQARTLAQWISEY